MSSSGVRVKSVGSIFIRHQRDSARSFHANQVFGFPFHGFRFGIPSVFRFFADVVDSRVRESEIASTAGDIASMAVVDVDVVVDVVAAAALAHLEPSPHVKSRLVGVPALRVIVRLCQPGQVEV